ncbi:MAG: hypothetical protein ACOZAN_01375 [Patescibacteria group bacterium]
MDNLRPQPDVIDTKPSFGTQINEKPITNPTEITQTDLNNLFGREVVVGPPPHESSKSSQAENVQQKPGEVIKVGLDDIFDPGQSPISQEIGQQVDQQNQSANENQNPAQSGESQTPNQRSEAGPTIEQLETNIDNIINSPGQYTLREITTTIVQTFGINPDGTPRSYQQFLEAEAESNPKLVQLVEQLKEILLKDEARYEENIIDFTQLMGGSGPEVDEGGKPVELALLPTSIGEITKTEEALEITTNSGEKIKAPNFAPIALFMALDLAFCKGRGVQMVVDRVVGLETNKFLAKLGFDVDLNDIGFDDQYNQFIKYVDTEGLIRFIEERNNHELFKFLSGLDRETRQKLLRGEEFGEWLNKRQLPNEVIQRALTKLESWQINELGVIDLVQKTN